MKYRRLQFPSDLAYFYLQQDEECSEYLDELVETSIGELLIDEYDNLAGYVFVKDNEEKGFIFNLFLFPEYRGHGLGDKLFKDAVNRLGGIDLTVKKDNTHAIDIYLDNDFVIVGDGNDDTEYYMKLESELQDGDS
jgi:ribosomal protein S18 acetylase RimI-like enzyme